MSRLDEIRQAIESAHVFRGMLPLPEGMVRELLAMAETPSARAARAWAQWVDSALAHHHERLVALEEANPPPAETLALRAYRELHRAAEAISEWPAGAVFYDGLRVLRELGVSPPDELLHWRDAVEGT